MAKKEETKEVKVEEQKYSCESILASKKYSKIDKCLLSVVLDQKQEYTLKQVDQILQKELGRKVL